MSSRRERHRVRVAVSSTVTAGTPVELLAAVLPQSLRCACLRLMFHDAELEPVKMPGAVRREI